MRHYRIELRTKQAAEVAQRIKCIAELPAAATDEPMLLVAVPTLADDRVELGPVVLQHIPTLPVELKERAWPSLITDAYMIALLARAAENWQGAATAQQLYAVLRSTGFRPAVAKGQVRMAAAVAGDPDVEVTDDEPEARDALVIPEAFLLEGRPDPDLIEMNAQWAYVIDQGEMLRTYEGRSVRMPVRAFSAALKNRKKIVMVPAKEQGKPPETKEKAIADWWMEHKQRRDYDRCEFLPGKVAPPRVYNTWPGWGVRARPGDCSKFWALCHDIICAGDQTNFEYLKRWMAYAVQHPYEPGHVTVVLHSGQGTGKGTFAKYFGRLFGDCYMQIVNENRVTGQFTGHLDRLVVVFIDEAVMSNDKKAKSLLKALTTEEQRDGRSMWTEAATVRNCLHLIMGSNERHVLDIEPDDRRYFVLHVSPKQAKDTAYFAAIVKEMDNGGAGALLHELQHMDLSGFDVRKRPQTRALADQIEKTGGPLQAFMKDLLTSGRLPFVPDKKWPLRVNRSLLRKHIKDWCDLPRFRVDELVEFVESWGCRGYVKPEGGGVVCVEFAPLVDMRRAWAKANNAPEWKLEQEWEPDFLVDDSSM